MDTHHLWPIVEKGEKAMIQHTEGMLRSDTIQEQNYYIRGKLSAQIA